LLCRSLSSRGLRQENVQFAGAKKFYANTALQETLKSDSYLFL